MGRAIFGGMARGAYESPTKMTLRDRAASAVRHVREGGIRRAADRVGGHLMRSSYRLRYRASPRRLWVPDRRIEIDRPLFVLSVQGGGVTLLARTLYRNRDVVYAGGNADFWAAPDEIHNRPHTTRDLPEALIHRSAHFFNIEGFEQSHPVFGFQRAWLYATDELLPRYRKTEDDLTDEIRTGLRRVVKKLIRAYAPDWRSARFVDKSQLYTIQLALIHAALEDCDPRFVLVTRDPYVTCWRAVQKEFDRRGVPSPIPLEERIRLVVEHWDNSFRLAREDASRLGIDLKHVRFEDFLEEPKETVRGICDFAELEYSDDMVPAAHHRFHLGAVDAVKWYPLRSSENAGYLEEIDRGLVRALNERAGDLIEAFGYTLIE